MKLALHILLKSLADLRRHAKSLAYNGVLIVVILIALDVFFPTIIEPEGDSSREVREAVSRGASNNLIKSIPILVFSSVFLVFAHRRILQPTPDAKTPFALRLKKTEIHFIMLTVLIGMIYLACFGLIYTGIGKWMSFKMSSGDISSFASMSWVVPTIIITTVLATYRFVLFAPLMVLGKDRPLRCAWQLSKGRFVMLSTLIAVPMVVQSVILDLVQKVTSTLAVNVTDTNVTQSMALWVVYLAVAAYAAMVLSNTYLELTQDEGKNVPGAAA
jgi:hypothetical protein